MTQALAILFWIYFFSFFFSVTALFYLEDSRRIHPRSVRVCQPKDLKGRERRSAWERGREREGERERECTHAGEEESESALASPFMCFPPPGPALCKLGLAGECCLFYLKSSLWSSDPPLTFLVFLATAILDSISLFYLRNIPPSRDGRPNSLGIGSSRSFWLLPAELGWRGVLVLPFLLVSSFRVLIAVSI